MCGLLFLEFESQLRKEDELVVIQNLIDHVGTGVRGCIILCWVQICQQSSHCCSVSCWADVAHCSTLKNESFDPHKIHRHKPAKHGRHGTTTQNQKCCTDAIPPGGLLADILMAISLGREVARSGCVCGWWMAQSEVVLLGQRR